MGKIKEMLEAEKKKVEEAKAAEEVKKAAQNAVNDQHNTEFNKFNSKVFRPALITCLDEFLAGNHPAVLIERKQDLEGNFGVLSRNITEALGVRIKNGQNLFFYSTKGNKPSFFDLNYQIGRGAVEKASLQMSTTTFETIEEIIVSAYQKNKHSFSNE